MSQTVAATTKPTAPKWETEARDAIKQSIRRFTKPLQDLVHRDANEGDTRLLVTDFLCDALGYDKYEDLTTEFAVRGEFADYGIRIDKQLAAFIEVKRAAQKLNVRHLRQVETYAVKEGLEWVILTNGQTWQAYHVFAHTGQQVETNLALEIDLLDGTPSASKVDSLFFLHRAALKRGLISDLWQRKAATAPAALAEVLLSEPVIDIVRRQIKKASGYNPDPEDLARILRTEVVKPELLIK